MAITQFCHHPDIFRTMIANPNWNKIINELLSKQTSANRSDLVIRVFELKHCALFSKIKNKHILKKVIAYIYTIDDNKIREPANVDQIICAQFPDQNADLLLFKTIIRCIVYRLCGVHNPQALYIKDKICQKKYPKEFYNKTLIDFNGYPLYAKKYDKYIGNNNINNR
ncbi:1357_t:CDS:2, partial [Gigaspora rosea]